MPRGQWAPPKADNQIPRPCANPPPPHQNPTQMGRSSLVQSEVMTLIRMSSDAGLHFLVWCMRHKSLPAGLCVFELLRIKQPPPPPSAPPAHAAGVGVQN